MLDKNQLEAINYGTGSALIAAGPGSGKTTVITHHILDLILNQTINPRSILVITFSKSAAAEMKFRFDKLSDKTFKVNFGTFHSVFFKLLKLYSNSNISICSDQEKIDIASHINQNESPEDFLNKISVFKSQISHKNLNYVSPEFIRYLKQYNSILNDKNLIDYDDILINCYSIVKNNENVRNNIKNTFRVILIDEFQDINEIQYETIKMISNNNIFAVGDEDQSIYSFRGADNTFMSKFLSDFDNVKTIYLSTNYRSNNEIVQFANNIIKKNPNRLRTSDVICGNNNMDKSVFVRNESDINNVFGAIKSDLKLLEDNNETIAFLFRNNKDLNFYKHHINVSNSYQNENIINQLDTILYDYLNVLLKNDISSFRKVCNIPYRFIPKSVLYESESIDGIFNDCKIIKYKKIIKQFNAQLDILRKMSPYTFYMYLINIIDIRKYIIENNDYLDGDYIDNIIKQKGKEIFTYKSFEDLFYSLIHNGKNEITENSCEKIKFLTFHSSKGLEFDNVFIPEINEGKIPSKGSEADNKLLEEERRLFYVAVTRAKKRLYLYAIDSPVHAPISRFLTEEK